MLRFIIFAENLSKRNLILLLTIALFTSLTACGPEKGAAKKANPKAKTTKTKAKAGKKGNATKKGAMTNADGPKLNADQKEKIAKIEAKYDKRMTTLRKKGEWTGDKNAKTRKSFNAEKTKELKAVLGGKYKEYIASKTTAKKKKK